MDETNSSDLFSPMMVVVWGVLVSAILLAVIWKVRKTRARRRRREAAREAQRQLRAWRQGDPPETASGPSADTGTPDRSST